MIEFDNLIATTSTYDSKIKEMKKSLNIDCLYEQLKSLEESMNVTGFWEDIKKVQEVNQEIKVIKTKIEKYESLVKIADDIEILIELGKEENDKTIVLECELLINNFEEQYETLKLETLFMGEYDKNGAIVTLHAGAGGTESCDWADMLFRMYTRYCDKKGFKTEILDYQDGDVAGVKSVSFEVSGVNVYGHFKGEKGIHRLVRLSPFDSSGRRHTSFASCDVMPVISDEIVVDIKDEDLRVDTFRASGAGGQHVNKTESAIRITHIPTGIVVSCQNERSQHKNRDSAMKVLKSKIFQVKVEEKQKEIDDIRGEVKDNGWGSQIRSYVFQPYNMVKDHRTGCETGNTQGVMDGNISEFINAYLLWINS